MRTTASISLFATLLALTHAQTTTLSPDESLVSILSTEGPGISGILSTQTDSLLDPLPTSSDDDTNGTGVVITNPVQPSPTTAIVPGNGTTSGVAGTGTGSSSGTLITLTSRPDASDVTATQTETSTAGGGIVETGSPDDTEGAGGDGAQQTGDTQSEGSAAATGVPVLLGALGLMGALAL